MKTTWSLHVHFVGLKLSNSSIVENRPVCLAAHGENVFDGHCRKRQTSTASPAKPGDLPAGLVGLFGGSEAVGLQMAALKAKLKRNLGGAAASSPPNTRKAAEALPSEVQAGISEQKKICDPEKSSTDQGFITKRY